MAYYNRSVHRNLGSRNLAVPTDSYIPMQVTEALSGEQVTVFNQDPALRGQFDRVYGNYPEMDQTYNGVEVTFNKRLDRWSILGGLTVGRATGDIYGRSADLNDPNYQFRRGVDRVRRAGLLQGGRALPSCPTRCRPPTASST